MRSHTSRVKLSFWIIATLGAVFLLVAVTVPRGHPDERRARQDFLAEHPTYIIERITLDEQEVVAMCYRISYRVPGDLTLREEFRQYLHDGGQWRISHRLREQ